MGKNARTFGQDLMRGEHVVGGAMGNTEAITSREWCKGKGIAKCENQTGTSIFDPVLCEIAYRWFCPPGGKVLDPFAGGSVRGIVAAKLGYRYAGIDLSHRQINANRQQAEEILGKPQLEVGGAPRTVTVSGKWARRQFSCTPEYITATCWGKCCQGADCTLISLMPDEAQQQREASHEVSGGLLQPDATTKQCPHKQLDGLCAVHGTPLKPFGCIASPFTLNDNGTLICRHRYIFMPCHGSGEPAYKTFRASLDLIFGGAEAARICERLDAGDEDVRATMPGDSYAALRYLDGLKPHKGGGTLPAWHTGDARNLKTLALGKWDFIFTCPPYHDLEVYSDDPRDLSVMDWGAFLAAYRQIIADACEVLRDDRFACFVVGDIRDRKGNYRNLPGETITAFKDAGLHLYNDGVLLTAVGSLPIRVTKQFQASRKLGKTHQNVLVFVKGDGKRATKAAQCSSETQGGECATG